MSRPEYWGPPKQLGGGKSPQNISREMEAAMPHRQSSGRTQPCSVRVTSLPSCPAARPVLCIPGDRGMLSTHIHGQRCRGLKGSCRQEEEEGWEGKALPLQITAAHCSRRQSSASRFRLAPPALSGMLSPTARSGSLSPRCWQVQVLSPPGLCPTPGVGWCHRAPITPVSAMACESLRRACGISMCKAGQRESR